MQPEKIDPLTFARQLRKDMTASEKILWELVRHRRILGARFLRQYRWEYEKGKYFFFDFYCPAIRLVLEADGEVHNTQTEYDDWRDKHTQAAGIYTLRFPNEKIQKDTATVRKTIADCVENMFIKN